MSVTVSSAIPTTTTIPPTSPPLPHGVQVRRLTHKDLSLLSSFQETHILQPSETENSLNSPQTLGLLTSSTKLLPGTSTACLILSLTCTPPTLHITTLFVAPEHRRQGLASVLLDHARRWAENTVGRCHRRVSNVVDVVVEMDGVDEEGKAFWERMGLVDGRGRIELA